MKLDHFDQLKISVEDLVEKIRQIKFRTNQLQKENDSLKKRIKLYADLPEDFDIQKLEELRNENERLKTKNTEAVSQIRKLIAQLQSKVVEHSSVDS